MFEDIKGKTSLIVLLRGVLTRKQVQQAGGIILLLCFFAAVEVIGFGTILPFVSALANPSAVRSKLGLDPWLAMIGVTSDRGFQILVSVLLVAVFIFKN